MRRKAMPIVVAFVFALSCEYRLEGNLTSAGETPLTIGDVAVEYRGKYVQVAPSELPFNNQVISLRLEGDASPKDKRQFAQALAAKGEDSVDGVLKWIVDPNDNSRQVLNPSKLRQVRSFTFIYKEGVPLLSDLVGSGIYVGAKIKSNNGTKHARIILARPRDDEERMLFRRVVRGTATRIVYLARLAFFPKDGSGKFLYIRDSVEIDGDMGPKDVVQEVTSIRPVQVVVFQRITDE